MENIKRLPSLFIGHGSPMNIISQNIYTQSIAKIGEKISPNIKSILCISAHWNTEGVFITGDQKLETIYDFSGFPSELYQIKYSPPGDLSLTKELECLLKPYDAKIQNNRGIDHGAWSVFHHMFPKANIPVVQLSLNLNFKIHEHYEMAKNLVTLREKGVLIVGSGNIVHSFFAYSDDPNFPPPDWAVEFDDKIKTALVNRDHETIVRYRRLFGKIGKISVPTEDHYLPLLYSIAVQKEDENINFMCEGFQNGAMSMRSFMIG